VGLVSAIAVAATVGSSGTTGAGSLSQLFAGPVIPPAALNDRTFPGSHSARETPFAPLVPAVPARPGFRPARRTTTPTPTPTVTPRRNRPATTHRTPTPPSPPAVVKKPRKPVVVVPPPPTTPPPSPLPTPPPPSQSVVRRIGKQVTNITDRLPAPVNKVVNDAVSTVLDLLSPAGPSGAAPSPAPRTVTRARDALKPAG
jgi:hypothetical protein